MPITLNPMDVEICHGNWHAQALMCWELGDTDVLSRPCGREHCLDAGAGCKYRIDQGASSSAAALKDGAAQAKAGVDHGNVCQSLRKVAQQPAGRDVVFFR
jgi:hypothetical protein